MKDNRNLHSKKQKKKSKKILVIFLIEILVLLLLFGSYQIYVYIRDMKNEQGYQDDTTGNKNKPTDKLSPDEQAVDADQERLVKEINDMNSLVAQADQMTLGYDYDGAINLIKSFKGSEGDYSVYTTLVNTVDRLQKEQKKLLLYGGEYSSVYEINHLFFHPLIADTALAFDGDSNSKTYNMYDLTTSEFKKILQSLYDQGYVLIKMSDLAKKETLADGTTKYVPNEIYLKQGKKPIIISEDDVTYYPYMKDDGIASRMILDDNGKPTCEMVQEDGTTATGAFDIVPIIDEFVQEHPDFSYKGAKGLLTLTGYEGILGYRTNDPKSPTYEADKEAAKTVADAMKSEGWEFGCISWGYKDMKVADIELLKTDTNRWLNEVGSLVGPTDIYAFPFGNDIESASQIYSGDKYQFLKSSGFNIFLGVYKEPWLHIKNNYVRMTRRPIDGQALLEFPDRLKDLFKADDIIDPERPAKDW